jgi:hypothetical protein
VLLHVLGHVEVDERVLVTEQELRERLRELGLPDAGGPRKMNEPAGRFGSFRPERVRRMELRDRADRVLLPDDALVELASMRRSFCVSSSVSLNTGMPVQLRQDLGDVLLIEGEDGVHAVGLPLLLASGLALEELLLRVAQGGGLLEVLLVDRRLLGLADALGLLLEVLQVRRGGEPADAQARLPASSMRSIALSGRKRSEM